ncbi:MAG: hypothetical protein WCO00_01885 [Rhodospirillaceae bacterium]
MSSLRRLAPRIAGLGIGLLALAGCANQYEFRTEAERVAVMDSFKNGKAILNCGVNCIVSWALVRGHAAQLYSQKNWQPLAEDVLKVGVSEDIAWFWLGAAAQGLRHYDAANHYYRIAGSIAATHPPGTLRCAESGTDTCYGINLLREIPVRLAALERSKHPNRHHPSRHTTRDRKSSGEETAKTSADRQPEADPAMSTDWIEPPPVTR